MSFLHFTHPGNLNLTRAGIRLLRISCFVAVHRNDVSTAGPLGACAACSWKCQELWEGARGHKSSLRLNWKTVLGSVSHIQDSFWPSNLPEVDPEENFPHPPWREVSNLLNRGALGMNYHMHSMDHLGPRTQQGAKSYDSVDTLLYRLWLLLGLWWTC